MSERDEALAKVEGLLDEIAEVDPEGDLVRSNDLGQANFRGAVPALDQTIGIFRELRSSDLRVFPLPVLRQITGRAEAALATFQAMRDFSLEGQTDVMAARDQLVARAETEYDEHFQVLEPHINYLLVKQTDFAAMESQARSAMDRLEEFTREKQEEQERIRQEMEDTLQTVKAAAAEAGVGQQSIVFGEQSGKDSERAAQWLKVSVLLGVVSVAYVIATLFAFPPSTDSTADVIRESAARLVILSFLAFALGFSIRQYGALKHNETVNRHRQNALRTFETFVRATDDKDTKDAVLLEATRSIFASQPSGFLRGGGEAESPSTIIEVIRRMGGQTSDQ